MPASEESLLDGLRRQEEAARALREAGAARLGWKAGFGTAAAIEKLGTAGPLAGFLTDATLAPSGATFEVGDWGKPVLEPEVAVRLSGDVRAGHSAAEIEAAVGEIGAAIELVDLGEAGSDPAEILAANIYHRAVLLGDLCPLEGDLTAVRIDVLADGDDYAVGADPTAVLGDLVDVLASMATLLDGSEDGLRAGDVIITGAAVAPLELRGGESIEVRVGSSNVSASID